MRFRSLAILVGLLAAPAMALAQGQALTWNYNLTGGISTATYPGNVVIEGNFDLDDLYLNGDAYRQPPNYAGGNDAPVTVVEGTQAAPATTASAAGFFEKSSSALSFDGLAGIAWKSSSAANARASAVYGEAIDTAGGTTTFAEGGRFQGTLASGANGAAYGLVCAAGATTTSTTPAYVIGCEGNTINQEGPDAPTMASFDANKFSAAFVATNGCSGCGAFKADAGIVLNPYNETPFRTGILIAANSIDTTGIGFRGGLSIVQGIDMGNAVISYAAMTIPNNTPIRAKNAAASADLSILTLDASNNLAVGSDITGQIVMGAQTYISSTLKFAPKTVAQLDTCAAGTAGTVAYVTDINGAAAYAGAVAGGGTTKSLVLCDGASWTQH